jgi:ArsR family transcriptional regulator
MSMTETDIAQAGRWFHALSDPTRLAVLRQLATGECCVCDLQGEVGAAQSRLSFHLKVLKEAGVVTDRKNGRWSYYALNPDVLEAMRAFLTDAVAQPHTAGCEGGCCR